MKALITFKYKDEEMKLEDLGYEIIFNDEEIFLSEDMKDAEVLVCFDPFKKLDIDLFLVLNGYNC